MFQLSPKERITKARVTLIRQHPFFGYLALRLKLVEKKLPECSGGLGVDFKGNLYFEPEKIKEWHEEELLGAVCHEILHIAGEHLFRKGKRDHFLWNIATDIKVNHILKTQGFKLPKNVIIFDEIFGRPVKDLTPEEIYDLIKMHNKARIQAQAPQMGQGNQNQGQGSYDSQDSQGSQGSNNQGASSQGGQSSQDSQGSEGSQDGSSGSEGQEIRETVIEGKVNGKPQKITIREIFDYHGYGEGKKSGKWREKWIKDIVDAHQYAKMQGKLPAGLEGIIDDLLHSPKIDWKSLLWRFIQKVIPQDYTWIRPSKKSWAIETYLPGVQRENIEIVIGLDTSGSISDEEYKEFLSEILGIAKSFENVRFTVMLCDAEIQKVLEDESDVNNLLEELRKRKGYGGTSFIPFFEWISENKPNIALLVVFTDGFGDFPNEEPHYPVIWVLTKEGITPSDVPFGEAIKLE